MGSFDFFFMTHFSFFRRLSCTILSVCASIIVLKAQVKTLKVDPASTETNIKTVHGPHLAMYDPQVPSQHKLILMIVGTGGSAEGSHTTDSIFATMGYHVVSLDYVNNVITVVCSDSKDRGCFDHYRQEIMTGTPVSEKVQVDSTNSILNRFSELMKFLVKNDPDGGWDEFVRHGRPRWDRIIPAGHSQGAGHAAYIGKLFKVDRVLLFSGPQDYLDNFQAPAGWQSQKGATPPSRYFAFLHLKDPFNVRHQLANCSRLMETAKPDSIMIQQGAAVSGHHHILITDIPTKDPHGSVLSPAFKDIWAYMLTAPVSPFKN